MNSKIDLNRKPILIILKHFYTLKAAEHEVVERIAQSTRDLGWEPRIVNVDGNFDLLNLEEIEEGADLVLDIHYEYPKFLKPRSIGAMWTPTSFMKEWDFPYVWENQLSHDELVHTQSQLTIDLLEQYRPDEEFGTLNHSLPSSWLPWVSEGQRNDSPHAFYAGINWSKLSGRPGRHHQFFKFLDKKDVLDLYGPKKVSHVIPWKGFESYRGEIPFDGKSLLLRARESGISLVLSAQQHLNEGMISSRLFEGLFAGNAIISDRHPFIERHLGNSAYYLDFDKGDEYAARQLEEYVVELRENPDKLAKLQELSHDIFLSKFDLTEQLKKILRLKSEDHERVQNLDALVLGSSSTGILKKLDSLGFGRVEFTLNHISDLQDLVDLAQSLDLKQFCIFVANCDFLDNFTFRLSEMQRRIESGSTSIGILGTVALTQGPKIFGPVIVPSAKSLPLSGMILDVESLPPHPTVYVDGVPSIRVKDYHEIPYVSKFIDTYDFLRNRFSNQPTTTIGEESVRQIVISGLADLSSSASNDVAEEIRRLPRGRKRAIMYALLASLPLLKPFVLVGKRLLRKSSK
jgi:hypothetical protein